jgi:peptide/nickel transport system permease protein
MVRYCVNRLMLMIPTLFGVSVLVFAMLRLMPGDPVATMFGGTAVTKDVLAAERSRLGLDQSVPVQFANWFWGIIHGNLGLSMWTGLPVSHEIAIRLQLSLQVVVMAALLAIVIALPLGALAAVFRNSWIDYVVRLYAISGLAIPSFWIGMLIILTLLALFSYTPPITFTPFWVDPKANIEQLIWPAIAVAYRYSAVATRMMRSSMLEVLHEDYIRTARAKGAYEWLVISRHALRNALLPVTTVIGIEFAFLIGGMVVTEQVFNLNGVGKLLVQAVAHSDYTLIQGLLLLIATAFVVANFVVDLMYAILDPRIRYS